MHRGILSDTVRIGALTACVKLSGAVKTITIARFFGTGDSVDAYLIAFLIPSFAGDVLAGAITPALLPALLDIQQRRDSRAARQLASQVLGAGILLLLGVALVAAVFSGPLLHVLASGFPPEKIRMTQTLLFLMLPTLPLSAATATFRTILNAHEHFSVAAFAPLLTPIAIIAGIYLLGGARALALGTLVGAIAELIVLAIAVWKLNLGVMPQWRAGSLELRSVLSQYAPVAASSVMSGGTNLIDQTLAATLGAGSVSALSYGTRLVAVFLSIGATSLATATLPRFSKLAAQGRMSELRSAFRSLAGLSLCVTVPLTLVLAAVSQPVVRILFQHGAFSASTTHLVGTVQMLSLFQIPFAVLLALVLRIVSSLKLNRLLVSLALFTLVANVVFDFVLMHWFAVAGIALSNVFVQAAGLGFLTWALFRRQEWSQFPLQPAVRPVVEGV